MPTPSAAASFLLAVDEHGGVLGFASEDAPDGEAMLRETAAHATVAARLVRVEMPLPPGSGSATVTVLDV
jgi:hypothetical protein